MKKMLVLGCISSILWSSSTQCLVGASFWRSYPRAKTVFEFPSPSNSTVAAANDGTALLILLAGATAAGFCYAVTCLPGWRLSAAQNTYNSFDSTLAEIIAYVDQHTMDFETLSARLYPCSAYPLVKMFNVLCSARKEAKEAVESLDAALWWSHKEPFVATCTRLKKLLNERIQLLDKCMTGLRLEPSWMSQYSLYLQQCNNERLERIEHAVWMQGCRTNTVVVPVQVK